MSKDPTPRADALRAQREARYGHLQAKVEPKKLIPYAGKEAFVHSGGGSIPYSKNPKPELTKPTKPARKRRKPKRKIA